MPKDIIFLASSRSIHAPSLQQSAWLLHSIQLITLLAFLFFLHQADFLCPWHIIQQQLCLQIFLMKLGYDHPAVWVLKSKGKTAVGETFARCFDADQPRFLMLDIWVENAHRV